MSVEETILFGRMVVNCSPAGVPRWFVMLYLPVALKGAGCPAELVLFEVCRHLATAQKRIEYKPEVGGV